ncbi:hypothetical protein [Mediterranea massiliensis]|uniref:hypothetical protein n=1 Tax=Mediterranea massiliensis TaxID=1841865 RepID=UPI0023F3F0CE|nr:hypothetical protein [Mediterranea massiliensis]
MEKKFSLQNILTGLKSNPVIAGSVPLGYTYGYPMLSNIQGELCLKVPFLRYKVTGEVDRTLVFPIRYLATFTLPEMKLVSLDDLAYRRAFSKIEFDKPCGLFRHEQIRTLTREQYNQARTALFGLYDKAIGSMLEGTEFSSKDSEQMKRILGGIVEPSLKPMYERLDAKFYHSYLENHGENH